MKKIVSIILICMLLISGCSKEVSTQNQPQRQSVEDEQLRNMVIFSEILIRNCSEILDLSAKYMNGEIHIDYVFDRSVEIKKTIQQAKPVLEIFYNDYKKNRYMLRNFQDVITTTEELINLAEIAYFITGEIDSWSIMQVVDAEAIANVLSFMLEHEELLKNR